MKRTITFLRNLVDFRKPVVLELECVDLVIEDYALLLMSWQFKWNYRVKVQGVKAAYCSTSGSAIVKIPEHFDIVTVVISNYYRKTTRSFKLRKVPLDEATLQLLISELHLMPQPAVHPFRIRLSQPPQRLFIPRIKVNSSIAGVHSFNINIIATSINYTAK